MNGTAITNRLQNSFKIKDNNLYGHCIIEILGIRPSNRLPLSYYYSWTSLLRGNCSFCSNSEVNNILKYIQSMTLSSWNSVEYFLFYPFHQLFPTLHLSVGYMSLNKVTTSTYIYIYINILVFKEHFFYIVIKWTFFFHFLPREKWD